MHEYKASRSSWDYSDFKQTFLFSSPDEGYLQLQTTKRDLPA